MKIIRRTGGNYQGLGSIERECDNLKGLNEPGHPNVIKYFDQYIDEYHAFIVMEFAPGRNIAGFRETPFTDPEAAPIFRQLCDAVHYLHCERNPPFIHRDIKPMNIILTLDSEGSYDVKLVDFGLARRAGSRSHMTTGRGTDFYVAPEVDDR